MSRERSLILDAHQIGQKLTRIAHEIYEKNYKEKEIVLVGVAGRGVEVAGRLVNVLKKISDLQISFETIEINKDKPLSGEIVYSGDLKAIRNKSVILVDDVLNSGRTLMYASRHILDNEPKNLSIATLVDRFHRRFPIRADYVGLTLSTNLKEHISVEMKKGSEAVYLE